MQWGKLQGIQVPGCSKIQSLKYEKEILFGRFVECETAKPLLLERTHMNHI